MSDFEKALRLKLRFDSPQGLLDLEDLWNLPLTSTRENRANLNDVAKSIARELKAQGEEDFVNPASAVDEVLQLKLEIVKHVIHIKQAENEEARLAADKREKKAKLLEVLARKENQELESKSPEEIRAMVDAL